MEQQLKLLVILKKGQTERKKLTKNGMRIGYP
jgi:hypothetical protein